MTAFSGLKNTMRKLTKRPGPKLLTVKQAWRLTPNMIRVVFSGPELNGFPEGREGGNCKLLLPEIGETKEAFAQRLEDGSKLIKRTYTVRKFDANIGELTLDFVAHGNSGDNGESGPASSWANHAKPGSFLGFSGPSSPKVNHFEADWYLIAADLSAMPVAAATLEAMPKNAKGVAIFEVPTEADKQAIEMPAGIDVHWLIHPVSSKPSTAQEDLIRSLDWPSGRVQTCIAGETGVIRALKSYLIQEKGLPRDDAYISGYWKIGLVEDEHQALKRAEG